MSGYMEGVSPRQGYLLPTYLDDLVDQENPVRFIAAFVDDLNLSALKFKRTAPAATGRPPYSARTMLKLYVYGHLNRIRSSRRLEKECARNIELWWLLERLCPDHNTIANFRAANRRALTKVFKAIPRNAVVRWRMNFSAGAIAKIEGVAALRRAFLQAADGGKGVASAAAELCGVALSCLCACARNWGYAGESGCAWTARRSRQSTAWTRRRAWN